MIYSLCEWRLQHGHDGVLSHDTEADAEEDFRQFVVARHRQPMFHRAERCLFRTEEDARAADQSTDDEIFVDEGKAYRVLSWERGYGFNYRNADR